MQSLMLLATVAHCAVSPVSDSLRLPDAAPTDGEKGGVVRIALAKEEYESGSFVIRSDEDLGKVPFEVSNLQPSTSNVTPPHPAAAIFADYWQKIASSAAPRTVFSVDAAVSKTGCDAYAVAWRNGALHFTGSNDRSLFYAVYDFYRRKGCKWFWDGDKLPPKGLVDVAGTDIREESRFEYRGIRYFAHRGLTRFQCEHWGEKEWRQEIDWCVKNRLNVLMLRIGMDDAWQKAFPDIVKYPDPAKPLPEALKGYDNRSLFWSLEFRGVLRKAITDYAVSRGLEVPTDFGTVSHWYSRTPKSFLAAKKPPFMPQASSDYSEDTGRVWDIREPGWLDEYWKLTEAQIAAGYGGSNLLHTIGFGERRVFKDRDANLKLKIDVNRQLVAKALEKYPSSKVLLAGWDFYYSWQPDEVRALIPHLDPKTTILWDYEADAVGEKNFTNWGVVGKFPYTFSIFLTYEMGLDIRANYKLIEERFAVAKGDPMCKGFIFWPESAHTDTLLLEYFTDNAWRPDGKTLETRLAEFCCGRYGKDAETMRQCWRDVIPVSSLLGYWGNAAIVLAQGPEPSKWIRNQIAGGVAAAKELADGNRTSAFFARLATADLDDATVRRDAVDLARTMLDRMLLHGQIDLDDAYRAFLAAPTNAVAAKALETEAKRFETLWTRFADLLAQHEDYSLAASLRHLKSVAPVRNPDFEKVLFENACNGYCTSHQYEVVAGYLLPYAKEIAAAYRAVAHGRPVDAKALAARSAALREEALAKPLAAHARGHATARRPTPANLRALLKELAAFAAPTVKTLKVGDELRKYDLHVPTGAVRGVVVSLPGYNTEKAPTPKDVLDRLFAHGFACAVPYFTKDGKGKCSINVGYPSQKDMKADDTRFLAELASVLRRDLGVGLVCLTGTSNGGEMCYQMAYRSPKAYDAIASDSGLTLECLAKSGKPLGGVRFLELHGMLDRVSPWAGNAKGGYWGNFLSVPEAMAAIALANGCSTNAVRKACPYDPKGTAALYVYPGGVDTRLVRAEDGGHCKFPNQDKWDIFLDFFEGR